MPMHCSTLVAGLNSVPLVATPPGQLVQVGRIPLTFPPGQYCPGLALLQAVQRLLLKPKPGLQTADTARHRGGSGGSYAHAHKVLHSVEMEQT